jgi:hypothetical protein
VEPAAAKRGLTVGEWCGEELLQAAGEPAPVVMPAEEILLAEVLALKTILLNLFYDPVHRLALLDGLLDQNHSASCKFPPYPT